MSALGHWFEQSGIPTVVIGLVPQHVQRIRPPRALLVPFELGRPLGVPGNRAFQHQVLDAALGLAERTDVPVLDWFDETAPEPTDMEDGPWACPVNFAAADNGSDDGDEVAAVLAEIALLRPWHDRAIQQRGSGVAAASGMDIEDAVRFLNRFLAETQVPVPSSGTLSSADAFKLAAEDLKLFYQVAAAAQPGGSGREVGDWFWHDSRAGAFIQRLAGHLSSAEDPVLKAFANFTLVPEARRQADQQNE